MISDDGKIEIYIKILIGLDGFNG